MGCTIVVTAPIIYLGARAGRVTAFFLSSSSIPSSFNSSSSYLPQVSFLEESALSKGIFRFLPLRIRNVFLRALAMGFFADLILAAPMLLIFWSLCWAEDRLCDFNAQLIGIFGLVYLLIQNMMFFPFVFAAGLNRAIVSAETLALGLKNAKTRGTPMKNSTNYAKV